MCHKNWSVIKKIRSYFTLWLAEHLFWLLSLLPNSIIILSICPGNFIYFYPNSPYFIILPNLISIRHLSNLADLTNIAPGNSLIYTICQFQSKIIWHGHAAMPQVLTTGYRFATVSRHFLFFVEDCFVGNSYTTRVNWNKFIILLFKIFGPCTKK